MSTQPNYVGLSMMLGIHEVTLDEKFWQRACELRVAIPAVVVSFNATAQTVVVQPAIQENIFKNLVPTPTNLPQLADVPVCFPRAGGFSLVFPIVAGDECLVIFADMCINAWWIQGAPFDLNKPMPNQEERRRHDLSDGIAIFGIWSQPRKLASWPTSTAQLQSDDGETMVQVSEGQVLMTPDGGTTTFNAISGQVTMTPDGGASYVRVTPGEINLHATTITINGASYYLHEHTGVTAGGGTTGPVV